MHVCKTVVEWQELISLFLDIDTKVLSGLPLHTMDTYLCNSQEEKGHAVEATSIQACAITWSGQEHLKLGPLNMETQECMH